jgi:hypothetical protein
VRWLEPARASGQTAVWTAISLLCVGWDRSGIHGPLVFFFKLGVSSLGTRRNRAGRGHELGLHSPCPNGSGNVQDDFEMTS